MSHATEDEAKLKAAAEGVFGTGFSMRASMGYWGNPICVFQGRVRGKAAQELMRKVASSVPVRDFVSCSERNKFYTRLDKAALLHGGLVPGDDVQLTARTRLPRGVSTSNYLREFWKG